MPHLRRQRIADRARQGLGELREDAPQGLAREALELLVDGNDSSGVDPRSVLGVVQLELRRPHEQAATSSDVGLDGTVEDDLPARHQHVSEIGLTEPDRLEAPLSSATLAS